MATKMDLANGQRAQRKLLITVAEWGMENTFDTKTGKLASTTGGKREILGKRTEDSSIEFNPDIETSTDILGITYSDVNKTEPQQDFDPFYILGGSDLGEYLTSAALNNDIDKYNNVFNIYVITAFINDKTGEATKYECVVHDGCSVIPTSIGGDSYISMPLEVHFSNHITSGTVDKLTDSFEFTPDLSV